MITRSCYFFLIFEQSIPLDNNLSGCNSCFMNRHDDLRLLLLAFAAEDRKHLLQQEAFAKTGFQALHLLCHKPDLTAAEAAQRLCLSAKQYQTICAKTYDYLKEVLL